MKGSRLLRPARLLTPVLLTLIGFGTPPLEAQSVGAGALLQTFRFSESDATGIGTLSLVTLPFSASVPLGSLADLNVAGAFARGSLDDASGTSTISGLTDTRVSVGFGAHWARVTAIAILPTGKATQTLQESRVAGAIAADLLPFAVSHWGGGPGGGVNLSAAGPVGAVGMGVSVAYLARQSFEPLDAQEFAYRPGDLLRVSVALDGTLGDAGKGTMRLTYERNGEDQRDDANLFRSGDRYQVVGSYAFPVGAGSSGIAYASLLHRSEGSFLENSQSLSSQDLVIVGGGVRIPMGTRVVQPDVEARLFRRGDGVDQGYDVAVGATYEIPGAGWTVVPSARLHLGRLEVRDGVETGFTGFEVGVAVRHGGAGS